MAQGSSFLQNVPPSTVSSSESEQPANLEKVTSAPSDVGLPNALASDASVFALAPAQYTKEDL